MTPELRLVVALVAHGNAQLRGTPCACGLDAAEGATASGVQEWRARLTDPAVRRLWAAHFQSDKGPGRWAIEVESAEGVEVWLVQVQEGQPSVDKLFFNVPELPRLLNLKEAEMRLSQAAVGHPLAEAMLVSFAPSTGPHLLPEPGLAPEAARLARTAAQLLLSLPPDDAIAPLRDASLGALLAAIHS